MPTRASTRGQQTSASGVTTTKAGGKASVLPVPALDASNKKQIMMAPPPVRFGSNGRSSQSVSFNNIIYLAGQHADDVTQDIAGQTKEVLAKIDKLLEQSMSDKNKLVRADIFLKDKQDFLPMNEVWEKWMNPKFAPPCSTVVVKDFLVEGVLVEIVVIANICQDYNEGNEEAAADVDLEKGKEMKEMIEQGAGETEMSEATETGKRQQQKEGAKESKEE